MRAVLRSILVLSSLALAIRADETDFVERDLLAVGIAADEETIVAYLEAIRPSDERTRRIDRHLGQLGDEDYATRETATRALIETPKLPRQLIASLLDDRDAEIRARARRILERADVDSHRNRMIPVLRWTIRERPAGVCPILLDLLPEWRSEPYVLELCGRAVAATARPEDELRLRAGLASADSFRRVVSLEGLLELGAIDVAAERLEDADESLRLAAAVGVLNAGRRDGLESIVGLLESDELRTRIDASRVLRLATGRGFGFAAYDPHPNRAGAVARWRTWLGGAGRSADLRLPIPAGRHAARGRTLVCALTEKRLVELDRTGQVVWQTGGFTYPWGCHALPNGHRLAVDHRGRFLVEYDGYGRRVWLVTDLPGNPTDVTRLPDGNTLVTLADPGLLVEIAPNKEIVRRLPVDGRPSTAQRLENGNTLVCLQSSNRVVEIDRAGEVRWQITGLQRAHTAQRLDNGNTLVCQMTGRVAEFDPEGELVWKIEKLPNPAQAQRLADGTTMVSADDGLKIYDAEGNVRRHVRISRSRFFAF